MFTIFMQTKCFHYFNLNHIFEEPISVNQNIYNSKVTKSAQLIIIKIDLFGDFLIFCLFSKMTRVARVKNSHPYNKVIDLIKYDKVIEMKYVD